MKRATLLALLTVACRSAPIAPAERYPAGTGYEAREVVADGARIRYLDVGRGPPVVLLHGLGASMYAWRKTIEPITAAGFRVIAFDQRGFGFSDKPKTGYSNADYVRLTVALLDSLGVSDAVLVGHAMGGQIALEVALAHPGPVRGLALLGASGLGVRHPFLLRIARWPLVGPLVSGLRNRSFTAGILRSTYADPAKVTEADVDQYYAPVAEPDYARALRGVLREYRFDALPERLDSVRVPALVLWGAHDRWIPPALGGRLAAGLERVAFFMIPRAGHALQEEAPDSTNRLLVTFLTEGLPRIPENLAGPIGLPDGRGRLGGSAGGPAGATAYRGVDSSTVRLKEYESCNASWLITEHYASSPRGVRSSPGGGSRVREFSALWRGRASTSSCCSTTSTRSAGSTTRC